MTPHAKPWSRKKLAGHELKVLTLRRRLEMARERAQKAESRMLLSPRDNILVLASAARWAEYEALWRYTNGE